MQERDQLRYDRHKERERQRRLARAHPEKRSKLDREKDRDVTEKIALGMPSGAATQEAQFDQRLFNQSKVTLDCMAQALTHFFFVCLSVFCFFHTGIGVWFLRR